jgi:hypothetical protein
MQAFNTSFDYSSRGFKGFEREVYKQGDAKLKD